jgi:hypothetical protein
VSTARVDALLMLVLAAAILATMQVLGVTLVAATLVIPATVARMVTDSFGRMLWLATGIGTLCGFVGMNLSYHLDVQSGPPSSSSGRPSSAPRSSSPAPAGCGGRRGSTPTTSPSWAFARRAPGRLRPAPARRVGALAKLASGRALGRRRAGRSLPSLAVGDAPSSSGCAPADSPRKRAPQPHVAALLATAGRRAPRPADLLAHPALTSPPRAPGAGPALRRSSIAPVAWDCGARGAGARRPTRPGRGDARRRTRSGRLAGRAPTSLTRSPSHRPR